MNASSRIRIRPLATTCRMFILAVFVAAFPASAISLVHVFAPDGYAPLGELCADGSGFLYGATANGGPWGGGILFRVRTDGTDYTILHEFGPGFDGASPRALVFDGSATLYGTTYRGGASGNGTVYRVGLDGGGYSVLHSFAGAPSGFFPNGPVVLSGGNLYGTTERGGSSDLGTLFSCNAVSGTVSILHSFTGGATDGNEPVGLSIDAYGTLFGTARSGGPLGLGVVYAIQPDGLGYALLHEFDGTGGAYPAAPPVPDGSGYLFGTAPEQGAGSRGIVYSIKSDGTSFAVVHAFAAGEGDGPWGRLTVDAPGFLTGTTITGGAHSGGTVFRLRTDGSDFRTLHSFPGNATEGYIPWAGILAAGDGRLYGPSVTTLYALRADGSSFQTLHRFSYPYGEGAQPMRSSLVQDASGYLYGTTDRGGANGYGTVFKVRSDGSGYAVLRSFLGFPDGASPAYSLTLDGTNLYGVTQEGGTNQKGTLFKLQTDGTGYTILRNFEGGAADGRAPGAPPISDGSGNLFGTAMAGGPSDSGCAYRVGTDGGGYTILHFFAGPPADGAGPAAALVQDGAGTLWGTTYSGGGSGHGVVFNLSPDGLSYVVLHSFAATDGSNPTSPLVPDGAGNFIGAAAWGGAFSRGTLFTVNAFTFGVLHSFGATLTDAISPTGRVVLSGGTVYGATSAGGASNRGTVYQMKIDGSGFALLHSFTGGEDDGAAPYGGVMLDGATLYGTTANGGLPAWGTVFRLTPGACAATATVTGNYGICAASGTVLQAALTGTGPWSVTWSDGVVQDVTSSPALRIVSPEVTTTYRVAVVTDSLCTGSTSGSAVVTVRPVPPAPIPTSNSPVCTAGTLNLFATPVMGASYWWTGPNGFTSASQNPALAGVSLSDSGSYSVLATVDGCDSPPASTAVTVFTDSTAPVVTPPAPVTLDQSVCCGTFGGVKPLTSPPLDAFLAAGSAVDDCDPAPTRLTPQLAGLDVDNGTCLEAGSTSVTFRFRDVSMHVGSAAADVTVRMFGDLNLDLVIDPSDMVILRSYFNFAIVPGPPPFTAPLGMADLTHEGDVDPSDMVMLRSYFNFAVTCLAP